MERLLLLTNLLVVILRSTAVNGQTKVTCSSNDRKALLDFKNGLNDSENTLSSWRGLDCCDWRGIGCNNITGGVITVDLHNPFPFSNARYGFLNLSGEIRPSLMQLTSLKRLDLSFNTFGGIPIPEFIGSLTNLRYLNLSNAGFSGKLPQNLGNLSNLKYLDVSNSGFPGLSVDSFQWVSSLVSLKYLGMENVDLSLVDSNWLEILNTLPHLTEMHLSNCGFSRSLSSLKSPNFTSLVVMDLSFNSFNSKFPDWLVNISSLVYIDLSYCMLRGRIPLGLGELPYLQFLGLESNGNLSASVFSFFNGSWKSIEFFKLASNKLHGKLPSSMGNMAFLSHFDLSDNYVEGGIPSTIGSLCQLAYFDISGNEITGILPDLLEETKICGADVTLPSLVILRLTNNKLTSRLPNWLGQIKNLEELSLSLNFFFGPLPESLGSLQHLTDLNLAWNKLNGTLPESFGELSELSVLDISSNYMTGIVSESHFSNLTKLKILMMSSNSFILNVSSDWIPPFQIRNLVMGSCRLGPPFPGWLKSQNEIMFLDISNASISGSIPDWFWDLSANLSLLNISYNQLQGELPGSFKVIPFADVDLSSNLFEGPIPLPQVPIELFDLSNNRFRGLIPNNISDVMPDLIFLSFSNNQLTGQLPADIGNMASLSVIDLSRNSLMGTIPSSIGNCSYLKVLDLRNNNLSGTIPDSLGQLNQLQSLHIGDNLISGRLPSSLKNLSRLETLDLRENTIKGDLPTWLGESFSSLRILSLRSNAFSGKMIIEFSNLSSLQILDLAENNLTGRIPTRFADLKAMAQEQMTNQYLLYGKYRGLYYEESSFVNLKNQFLKFTKTLSLVTAIDLSGNNLSGDFPVGLTALRNLVVLNLSGNHITGQIPENISMLRQLASLDLSSNDLFGVIPPSMASLSFLSYLNLSNNNLSGKIPYTGQMLTFDVHSFEGNHGLCGTPLVKCPDEDKSGLGNDVIYDSNNKFIDQWFYLSIGLGFAAGILVPYLVLMMRKPWSDKYFDFVDKIVSKFLFARRRP
ncbi:receptor-like protein EIX2 [Primulina huaijiensis]|uniref:receptor-like protein EIX2 n=1 Tax=Primulina huaijiensis TaxID=1492673 RepID=UPI003CC6E73F